MSDPVDDVSGRELARLLDLTERRVRQLADEGVIQRSGRGRYPFASSVHGYIRFLEQNSRRAREAAASNPVAAARAREIELRIAEREAKLIETDQVFEVVDEIIDTYRSFYAGLASRATRDLPLRRKIQAEIDATQTKVDATWKAKQADIRRSAW